MSDSAGGDVYQSGPSTSNQFLRRWSLVVTGANGQKVVLSDSETSTSPSGGTSTASEALRIQFKTKQLHLSSTRGELEVTVFNLPSSFAQKSLIGQYNRVTLSAGYKKGRFGVIFDGVITRWKHGRNESFTETYLTIWGAAGDLAVNQGIISTTHAAGTTAKAIVQAAADTLVGLGVALDSITGMSVTPYIRGAVSYGMSVDQILEHGRIQITNNKLTISPANKAATGQTFLINSNTGLVGMAETTQDAVEFTCLLNPDMEPNCLVKIDQASINQINAGATGRGQTPGQGGEAVLVPTADGNTMFWFADISADGVYTAIVVEHEGDTRNNPWYTHVKSWTNSFAGSSLYQYGVGPTDPQIANLNAPTPANTPNATGPNSINQTPGV